VKKILVLLALMSVLAILFAGCGGKAPAPPPPPPLPPVDTTPVAEEPPPPPPPPPAPLVLTTIHFEYDKYRLTNEATDIMAANAVALDEHPNATIRIEGHCDERGSDEYNMALGEKRAAAARDYLVSYGISPSKISIISYGESRPVDPGQNEDAWARNRRGEFKKISE